MSGVIIFNNTRYKEIIWYSENKQTLREAKSLGFNSPSVMSHLCHLWHRIHPLLGFIHQKQNNGNNEASLKTKWSEKGAVLRSLTAFYLIIWKRRNHNLEQNIPDYVNLFYLILLLLYWSRLWTPCSPTNTPGSSTTHCSLCLQMWNGSCSGHPLSSSASISPYIRGKWLKTHVSTNTSFLHQIFSESSRVPAWQC